MLELFTPEAEFEIVSGATQVTLQNLTFMRLQELNLTKEQTARILGRAKKARVQHHNQGALATAYDQHYARELGVQSRNRRRLSRELRHMHLARGMLSGTPYKAMENEIREGNEPDAKIIANFTNFLYDTNDVATWMSEDFTPKITEPDAVALANKRIAAINELIGNESIPEARREVLLGEAAALEATIA